MDSANDQISAQYQLDIDGEKLSEMGIRVLELQTTIQGIKNAVQGIQTALIQFALRGAELRLSGVSTNHGQDDDVPSATRIAR